MSIQDLFPTEIRHFLPGLAVLLFFYFFLRARRKHPIYVNESDFVLTYGKFFGFIGVLAIATSLPFLYISIFGEKPEDSAGWMYLSLGLLIPGAAFLIIELSTKFVVNKDSMRAHSFPNRTKTIDWKDVTAVKYSGLFQALVFYTDQEKIRVPILLSGFEHFNEIVIGNRLPKSVTADAKEALRMAIEKMEKNNPFK